MIRIAWRKKMSKLDELETLFLKRGIPTDSPEFYNNKNFRIAEGLSDRFFWNFAEYVCARQYSLEYLARAEATIPLIIQFLFEALKKDGRLGACLDASLATAKILEKYGFWTLIQTGSLTIQVPNATHRPTRHWAELRLPSNPAKVGHAWLVVPPFKTIDLTVTRQEENEDLVDHLPAFIIAKEVEEVEGVSLEDMMDRPLRNAILRSSGNLPSIQEVMKNQVPEFAAYMRRFRPSAVKAGSATLKYFPCRPTAAEESFEKHTGNCFSGRSTPEIFGDLVRAIGSPEDIGYLPSSTAKN